MQDLSENYWQQRYEKNQIQWDLGAVSPPLEAYFNQLDDPEIDILIPGGGNSYEAEYLFDKGFKNVFVADLAPQPLRNLRARVPQFPEEHLLQVDFFELTDKKFDLIVEQTFFCALTPNLRPLYASKMFDLLKPDGKLVGLLFDVPLNETHPPFGGSRAEYLDYFDPLFTKKHFETAYNSIPPRANRELFIHLTPKKLESQST